MRISDWSSDVCSSDLLVDVEGDAKAGTLAERDGCPASQPAHVEAQVGVVQHQTVGAGFEAGLQHQAAQTLGRHRFDITAEPVQKAAQEIGGASCRERVCQYV